MSKRGLGRGLDALIPSGPSHATDEGAGVGILEVALDDIAPNPHQPRSSVEKEDLSELAASIREHGLIQPLIVTHSPSAANPYQLIAGERRWRAARLAGLTRVQVLIKEATPQAMLELALVENVQRADLNPLEEAAAYQQLIEEFGLTQARVAERVGKSRTAVANTLRLLRSPPAVKQALLNGEISEGHARALLALPSDEAQTAALDVIFKRGLSVRQTEALVRRLQGEQTPPAQPDPPSPGVRSLESAFRQALGTKVSLQRGKKGGRLVIYYYSDEELDHIYQTIVGQE